MLTAVGPSLVDYVPVRAARTMPGPLDRFVVTRGLLIAALDPEGVIGAVPTDRESQKLWAGVVRTSIEIGLNLWVFLSAKTRMFFDGRRAEA